MTDIDQSVIKAIRACNATYDELYTLLEECLEGNPTKDQQANMINGIMELNRVRVEKVEREYRYSVEQKT